MLNERLQNAMQEEVAQEPIPEEVEIEEPEDDGIVTTDEELEAYMVVRAILAREYLLDRFSLRDTKSYCNVLLDGSNRKPICRFRFNSSNKYFCVFDDNREEVKYKIESISDIYQYQDQITATVRNYDH